MRRSHPTIGLERLCALFGVTRQAYYEAAATAAKTSIIQALVLTLVKECRESIPMLGTRKLLHLLQPKLRQHGVKMGRDQLFELLRFHGLLIRSRKRIVKTTNSHHWLKKYPNLIVDIMPSGIEQLWVSDITYIRTVEGFSYLSLITDAYSHKIVGYALCPTLEAVGSLDALNMAIQQRVHKQNNCLIHHSDRGIQYCCFEYVETLMKEGIAISMTQSGSPYENAMAERVNGILKNEFYPKIIFQNHAQALKAIKKIVRAYNELRPHASIDYMTPNEAHQCSGVIKKRWKKYPKYSKNKEVAMVD